MTLIERLERAGTIHDALATCHPSLSRGMVWCTVCGTSRKVDSANALAHGWPKCCGYTMTIDSPEERRAREAMKEKGTPPDTGKDQSA